MKTKILFLILLYCLIGLMYCTTSHGAPMYVTGTLRSDAMKPRGVKAQIICQDPYYDVVSLAWLKSYAFEQSTQHIAAYRQYVNDCDTQAQILLGKLKEHAVRSGAQYSPAVGLVHVFYKEAEDGRMVTRGHAMVIARTERGWFLVDPTNGYSVTSLDLYKHKKGINFILF